MAFKLKGFSYTGSSPQKQFIGTGVNIGGRLEGENIDGEYALSAEEMVTPGIKRKLRKDNPNIKFYGEHQQMVDKKRSKRKRMARRGKHMDWATGQYVKTPNLQVDDKEEKKSKEKFTGKIFNSYEDVTKAIETGNFKGVNQKQDGQTYVFNFKDSSGKLNKRTYKKIR